MLISSRLEGNSYPQSVLTIERLAMLYSLLPAALVFVAALVILRYSLTKERVEAFQRERSTRAWNPSP